MVLDAINGGDTRDPGSIDQPFNHDALASIDGIRIGYLPSAYEEDAVTELDRQALREVRSLGLEVSEVTLPDLPYASLVATLYAEAAASFEQLTLSDVDDTLTRQDDGAWPNAFRKARFLSAVDHVQLDRLRRRVMEAVGSLFDEIDVLVGPVSAGPMLVASNFTGHPALVLRAGFEHVPTRSELSLAKAKLELGGSERDRARSRGSARSVPVERTLRGIGAGSGRQGAGGRAGRGRQASSAGLRRVGSCSGIAAEVGSPSGPSEGAARGRRQRTPPDRRVQRP